MREFAIEQALYHRPENGSPYRLAQSSGFQEEWNAAIEALILGFGDRPRGAACPPAVFARPLGRQRVAVVHVADQEAGALGFYFLILPQAAYTKYLGDPFAVAERLPPDWRARGTLATLTWPEQSLPPRTIAHVQSVLKRIKASALREDEDPETVERTVENAESPALLGGVQILVDGGRVVFERPAPDTPLLRGLWTLLPSSTRCTLWPASFAFSNALGFDALITPNASGAQYKGYYHEEQASEYPPGRYELALQTAAETGDQAELNSLLSRRSTHETFKMALTLLILVALMTLAFRFFEPKPPPVDFEKKAAAAAGIVGVADPWTALGLIQHGNNIWLNQPKEQTR